MISQFLLFVLVGFAAQIVDGALGMAYGVISTGVLVTMGIPPTVASAAVHTAEIATTGISGFSHAMFKNIDYALFRRLAIPGIIGSIIGAYVLTKIPVEIARPLIAFYLIMMGGFILYKASQGGKLWQALKKFIVKRVKSHKLPSDEARGLIPLGLAGGFFDASGGGGWGPIVTSNLLAQGTTPHYTIGSVNLTEFLVTVSVSATFFFTIGLSHWPIILGLIVGGAIAAPLAALMVRFIQPRVIMLLAGIVVILLGIRMIIRFFL
ncbi:sulfite exporter TauE/SafE family protein [Legionella oakridgensis]|uniref:Probable membrane transporter protein n=2 Tax=Legionella oakridgensis TaxID=29423 RepID=W0BG47_9GAMM|nr:sulfite exporter TauE/SafE family protein [Legionella oakridgensis]AHE67602.1 putative permease [Legionella oakridgensis ATCC 33761 = DSM 21215]ETO92841.1 putative permease [Legionella oakridgensis RV-2-2007]KTD37052.1 Sulfite exporter TauE/SafE [Legionella oakridgensis]STY20639.1 Sulfite exporter TauE/SafE [Legionella longbeachae]